MNLPIDKLIEFRHELHKNPELAHKEENTAERIINFLNRYSPDKIVKSLGGYGVAAIFKGKESGPTILIRADLDALPIKEENDFEYKSVTSNVAHKCGHDGHMTIVSGLAILLNKLKPEKGKVVLLFQPAEETGEGAAKVISDEKFNQIKPDYVFALHNLPGFESNSIITRHKNFAAASRGMIIKLEGKTSHAAEPENGRSPALAVAQIIYKLENLTKDKNQFLKDFSLVTLIHTRIGEKAFGTTPGYAEVMFTLRAYEQNDMNYLTTSAEKIVKEIASTEKLKVSIEWCEDFPATVNDDECVAIIKESIQQNNLREIETEKPFKWSEDFGHFTKNFKGALFGLGAGINTPKLHNPDYDFPDDIIETGIKMFYSIINNILKD